MTDKGFYADHVAMGDILISGWQVIGNVLTVAKEASADDDIQNKGCSLSSNDVKEDDLPYSSDTTTENKGHSHPRSGIHLPILKNLIPSTLSEINHELLSDGHSSRIHPFGFRASVHTFKAKTVTSTKTRVILDAIVTRVASGGKKLTKKQKINMRNRSNRKARKIQQLPSGSKCSDKEHQALVVAFKDALKKHNVFYSGNGTRTIPGANMHYGNSKIPVFLSAKHDLRVIDFGEKGGHIDNIFTLVPAKNRDAVMRTQNHEFGNYFIAAHAILKRHKTTRNERGIAREVRVDDGRPPKYLTQGSKPNQGGRGVLYNTAEFDEFPKQGKLMANLFSKMELLAKEIMDSSSICALRQLTKLAGYKTMKKLSIFPSAALALNCYLSAHKDLDFGMSVLATLCNGEPGGNIRSYFCFPEWGFCVPIRNGDVLLFNPLELHCMSSRVNTQEDLVCAVLYIKTAVVGGNDNNQDLGGLYDMVGEGRPPSND